MPKLFIPTVYGLILYWMGANNLIDFLLYRQSTAAFGGNTLSFLENLFVVFLGFALSLRYRRQVDWGSVSFRLAIVFSLYLMISAGWSGKPAVTLQRSILFLSSILSCFVIAQLLPTDRILSILTRAAGITAILSILMLGAMPNLAVMPITGEARGIFVHKNVLGQVMAYGLLTALYMAWRDVARRRRHALLAAVCLALVLLSRSATAFLISLIFISGYGALYLYRRGSTGRLVLALGLLIMVPAFAYGITNEDEILLLLGKDPTLTGRTEIWAHVIDDIYSRPAVGWGYSGFWNADNPAAVFIYQQVGWTPPHAHNGLLEALLELGVFGTALLLLAFFRNITLAIRCIASSDLLLGAFSMTLLIGTLALGFSEAILLNPQQFSTILFFLTGMMCEKTLQPYRRRAGAVAATPLHRAVLESPRSVAGL